MFQRHASTNDLHAKGVRKCAGRRLRKTEDPTDAPREQL